MTLEELLAKRETVKQDVRNLAQQITDAIEQGKLDGIYPDGMPVEITNIKNMTDWYTSVVKAPVENDPETPENPTEGGENDPA